MVKVVFYIVTSSLDITKFISANFNETFPALLVASIAAIKAFLSASAYL